PAAAATLVWRNWRRVNFVFMTGGSPRYNFYAKTQRRKGARAKRVDPLIICGFSPLRLSVSALNFMSLSFRVYWNSRQETRAQSTSPSGWRAGFLGIFTTPDLSQ